MVERRHDRKAKRRVERVAEKGMEVSVKEYERGEHE